MGRHARRLTLLGAAVLIATACTGPPDASRCAERLDITPTVPTSMDRPATSLLVVRRGAEALELLEYRFADGSVGELPEISAASAPDVDLAPDGTRLVVATRPGDELIVVDVLTGARTSLGVRGTNPAWSPEGTMLAVVTAAGELVVVGADGSDPRRILPSPDPGPIFSPSWSPDGTLLAVAVDGDPSSLGYDELHLIDPAASTSRRIARGVSIDAPAWAPDGTRVAFHDFGGIRIACRDGGLVAKLSDDGVFPVWSPDAAEIAFTSLGDGGPGLVVVPSSGGAGVRITEGEDVAVSWTEGPIGR